MTHVHTIYEIIKIISISINKFIYNFEYICLFSENKSIFETIPNFCNKSTKYVYHLNFLFFFILIGNKINYELTNWYIIDFIKIFTSKWFLYNLYIYNVSQVFECCAFSLFCTLTYLFWNLIYSVLNLGKYRRRRGLYRARTNCYTGPPF